MHESPPATIDEISGSVYTVPTDLPESDGTLEWDSTTVVVASVSAGGQAGIGWTYGHKAIATLIETDLSGAVLGCDPMDVQRAWAQMVAAIRNNGRPGLSSMAIAAVDIALWDLKAKLLSMPLATLLGGFRDAVPVYGSGGFTSYSDEQLREQLAGWVAAGIGRVKMKIGRERGRDPSRVRAARDAIGPSTQLFVDANGAYQPSEAIAVAHELAPYGVVWLEEPVSSDDLAGLREVRSRTPPGMEVAAGEYGFDLPYFERMLAEGAVDVLQADVTRCAGITQLLCVDALCSARSRPLSLHCAPAIHGNVGTSLQAMVHLEYFHDHVRIEQLLFDGVPKLDQGSLAPNRERPGHGVKLRADVAQQFAV
jgi:L-alanine-DL-glutamate epimerase-like enolase superfamily enzyme